MGRRRSDDGDDDAAPPPGYVAPPARWESATIKSQLDEILAAVEAPTKIDDEVRGILQRKLYRGKYFGHEKARGDVTLTLRTILESVR
jgi:hypothetical protein